MPAFSKKHVFVAVLAVAFLVGLIAFLKVPAPAPPPLQFSLLEQTNSLSGAPLTLVNLTNQTGHARWFYLVTEFPCPTGWTSGGLAEGQPMRWHRLGAHAECQVSLPAPPGAAKWRFRCTSMREVKAPEGWWYVLVRRAGLSRMRLRDQPPASYVWTAPLSQ